MRHLLVAAFVAAPALLAAQDDPFAPPPPPPVRGGLFLMVAPVAYGALTSKAVTNGEMRSGVGFAMEGGFGLTTRFAMLADLTVTPLVLEPGSSYHLIQAQLLARPSLKPLRLGMTETVVFFDAGGGVVRASGERPALGSVEKHAVSGSFLTVGLGTSVFFKHTFAITASAHGSYGAFSDEKVGNVTAGNFQVSGGTLRAAIGLTWQPKRP